MPFTILEGPDGQPIPATATTDGAQHVTDAGLVSIDTDTTALASTVTSGIPNASDPGVAVKISASAILQTEPAPNFTATAPTAGADTPLGTYVYLAGLDRVEQTVNEQPIQTLAATVWQGGPFSVDQGVQAGIDKPWPVVLSDGVSQAGTEANPVIVKVPEYNRTSFGQLRVATREILFEDTQDYLFNTRLWATRIVGAGTVAYNSTSGLTALSVSAASGDVAEIGTHTFFPYEPGAASHTMFTLSHADTGQVGQTREWGFGGQNNVYMFRLVGTTLNIVIRGSASGVATDTHVIAQADWNVDTMLDGTGPSGRTLDLTKINQWEIDYQWLSAGLIRFAINGQIVHLLDLRGALTLPSTRTGHRPLRMTITNTAASTASAMYYKCSVVHRDGGTATRFEPGAHSLTAPKTSITTTFTPVLAIRLAATFQGQPNRKIVIPRMARIANASGRGTVRLYFNPSAITVVGAWTPVVLAPWLEYHENITSITGGTNVSEVFLPNAADARELDGAGAFALNGTHMRRTHDNASGDSIVFSAAATLGNIDIVSLLATFNTLG